MTARTSVITDWRTSEEDLPDVAPGEEYERVIAPQKFVVLRRIIVRDMALIHLQIGVVEVPFELESTDGSVRRYRPKGLDDDALKKRLVATGAAVATSNSIAIAPNLEIRTQLRNEGDAPTKPRAALLVQEEIT
jgi:hypothetical protein